MDLLRKFAKQDDWYETEEGKEYLETLKPYESVTEFFRDLSKIEKFDYKSSKSSMEDAIEHSRKVLTVLLKSEGLELEKDRKDVSEALKIIGCVPFKKADKKFRSNQNIGVLLFEENVAFPLSAYTQLIDTKEDTFSYGLEKMLDGGADGWIGSWLTTQKMAENEKEKSKE